jgi:hypothetical protein
MDTFDKTISIQASPDLVWKEARRFAKKGRIISEKNHQLLVSIGKLKIGYVYLIHKQPDGSTLLRHVISSESAIRKALGSNRPISDELDEIDADTETVSETVSGLFKSFLEFPEPETIGEDQLSKIRSRAERAAG